MKSHSLGGELERRARRVHVVGHDAVAHGDAAGREHLRGDRVAVGVADLAGAGLLGDLDELAAGREHAHARAAVDGDRVVAGGREQADGRRADERRRPRRRRRPRAPPRRGGGCARRASARARTRRASRCRRRRSTTRVCSTITTESAPAGTGAPVMMRAAWPGPTSPSHQSPAAMCATTSSSTGASSLAPARSAARTAKPSIAELSNGATSMSLVGILGEHAAERVEQRDALGGQRLHEAEHELERLLDGHRFGHGVRPPRRMRRCAPRRCRR